MAEYKFKPPKYSATLLQLMHYNFTFATLLHLA